MSDQTLIRVEKLTKHFPVSQNVLFRQKVDVVQAVDGVSFDIRAGRRWGWLARGCGKTTVGRLLVRLYPPTSGTIYYGDIKLSELRGAELLRAGATSDGLSGPVRLIESPVEREVHHLRTSVCFQNGSQPNENSGYTSF